MIIAATANIPIVGNKEDISTEEKYRQYVLERNRKIEEANKKPEIDV